MEINRNPEELERQRTNVRLSYGDDELDHILRAKRGVVEYWNEHVRLDYALDPNQDEIDVEDLYVVKFTFVLGSWKAMISSDAWSDTSYFEVTYNVMAEEMYVDHYRKVAQAVIPDSSEFKIAKLRKKLS